MGRLFSIPVTLIDVALDILKGPVSIIESLALAAINLVGAAFSKKFSVKNALDYLKDASMNAVIYTPVTLALLPFKTIYQVAGGLIAPDKVHFIDCTRSLIGLIALVSCNSR